MIFNWRRREGEAGRDSSKPGNAARSDAPRPPVIASSKSVTAPVERADASPCLAPLPYERACCCGAQPRVRVLMFKTDLNGSERGESGRASDPRDDFVDLLLCDHHYRAAAARLSELGAIAIGTDGRPVPEAVPAVVRVPAATLKA